MMTTEENTVYDTVRDPAQEAAATQAAVELLDPGLATNVDDQRQAVSALEQALNSLSPEEQQQVPSSVWNDIQSARNANSMGQLADPNVISRVSQTLNDKEMKKMLENVAGGAMMLGGAGLLLGGKERKDNSEIPEFSIVSGVNGLKINAITGKKENATFTSFGDLIPADEVNAKYAVSEADPSDYFTPAIDHGIGMKGAKQAIEEVMSRSGPRKP